MPFKKGQSGNPDGKKAGTKNSKTLQWEQLGEAIITTHAERFNGILHKTNDEKFVSLFVQVLEHFKPKLSREDGTKTVKQEINVNFRRKG